MPWRALAVTKGWTVTPQGGPIEIEVAATTDLLELTAGGAQAIPTMGAVGYFVLGTALAAAALIFLRRRS